MIMGAIIRMMGGFLCMGAGTLFKSGDLALYVVLVFSGFLLIQLKPEDW